jgi:NADH dehydrogenase
LADTCVVTGAFSYTGSFIAARLLARGESVRTLSRTPAPADSPIVAHPFAFDDPAALARVLKGARVLYNTYWIRFPRGSSTFERAVANTRILLRAAREAGVERVVHVSVTNPMHDSPLAYFRGKAELEDAVCASGLGYGIVRPTLIFGAQDILVNNIAWILRRFPLFVLPGSGAYRVQPVSAEDTARICVDAGDAHDDLIRDAAGPDTFAFAELVRAVARAIGVRRPVVGAPAVVTHALGSVIGAMVRDVLLTRDEIAGLRQGLLVSEEPPLGRDRFEAWLSEHADALGRRYVSELARNYR